MKIRVLTDTESSLKALKKLYDWADEVRFAYAWISTNGAHWDWLDHYETRRSVVGADFLGTDPAVFEYFLERDDVDELRVITGEAGTFHPKVMLGVKGGKARAIVGSSNLTAGGFGKNTEVNLQLTGRLTDAPLADLRNFVEAQWTRAHPLTRRWVDDYRARFEARAKPSRSPAPPEKQSSRAAQLDVSWDDWFELLTVAFGRVEAPFPPHIFDAEGSYLSEARACEAAFASGRSFAEMSSNDRRILVGRKGRGLSNGSFGGGGASGIFMNTILNRPEALSQLLDRIPSTGPVELDAANTFLRDALALDSVGMAGASRLLAMKRPDRFMPINGGNRAGIRNIFGFGVTTPTHYRRLHELIWAFPWASAPEPDDDIHRLVWRWRIALLDAAAY